MRLKIQFSLVVLASVWLQPFRPLAAIADAANPHAGTPLTGKEARPDALQPQSVELPDSWRLVRIPNSRGGDYTAITHTADLDRSDPRLAGLMLRCGEKSIETVIVVVEPFPPQAQPKITLRAAGQESYFVGSIIPTGAGVLLPVDGMRLATGSWRGSQELGVKITNGATVIDGVVTLSGLPAAIQSLAGCAPK